MKKIISLLLVLCMCVGVMPMSQALAADDDLFLQFSDDFEEGNKYWKGGNGVSGGKLKKGNGFGHLELNAPELNWQQFVLEFDVKITGEYTGKEVPWHGFRCKGFTFLWNLNSGKMAAAKDGQQNDIGEAKIEIGKNYMVRIEAKSNYVITSVKEEGKDKFTEVGYMKGTSVQNGVGPIQFSSYYPMEVDNVKVYAYKDVDLTVKEKMKDMAMGDTYKLDISNKNGEALTYESLNPEIASVDETGTVLGKAKGIAVISVKDSTGKQVETAGVQVYIPVTKLNIAFDEKVMYVGDAISVDAEPTPSNGLVIIDWTADKEGVVEFVGTNFKRRTIVAKGVGETTVTATDKQGGVKETVKIIVKPKEEKPVAETETATIKATGSKTELSSTTYGMAMIKGDFTAIDMEKTLGKLKEIKAQTYRIHSNDLHTATRDAVKSGKYATVWEYMEAEYQVWKPQQELGIELHLGVQPSIYAEPNNANISLEDSEAQWLEAIKNIYDLVGPFTVEMGNETYAIDQTSHFATAKDYFDYCVEFSKKVKAISPDIKVSAQMIAYAMESEILADPANQSTLENDWAYTQGSRANEWNPLAGENSEHFDSFTSHDYFSSPHNSGQTADEWVLNMHAWTDHEIYADLNLSERVGGKKIDHTEWGTMNSQRFWGANMTNEDKALVQWMMYPAVAQRDIEQMLVFAKTGVVNSTHYHAMTDGQGFGLYPDGKNEGVFVPNRFAFEEIGRLFSENTYSYDLHSDAEKRNVVRPHYGPKDLSVVVNNVEAWGLGDENALKTVVVSNRTNGVQKATLSGAKLKPVWSYGGEIEEIAPDWMVNSNYTSPNAGTYVDTSLKPNLHEGTGFTDTVELPPYTIMVCEVEGTPDVIDGNNADKTSKIAEYFMKGAVVLKIDENYGFVDNLKKPIDAENASVAPIIKNDRTLVPLRFISESMGCEVNYDAATKGVTISGDGVEVKLTIGEKKYYVNGEEKEFDVEAQVVNDRTLLPLRAMAEAIGKDVQWDPSGLIVITYPGAGFEPEGKEWMSAVNHDDLLKILNLFN